MESVEERYISLTINKTDGLICTNFVPKKYGILSCNGYPFAEYIESVLIKYNLAVVEKRSFTGYIKYANLIYRISPNVMEDHIWLGLLLKRYNNLADTFQVWYFSEGSYDNERIKNAKWEIRRELGFKENVLYKANRIEIQHHYLHIPEVSECFREYNLLSNFPEINLIL